MMARSLPRRDSGLEAYATRKRRVPKAYPAKRRGAEAKVCASMDAESSGLWLGSMWMSWKQFEWNRFGWKQFGWT